MSGLSCGARHFALITWDDWGGWYDHVPPPQIGQSNGWGQSYVYGFRVPLLVVSAYTPAGYVNTTLANLFSAPDTPNHPLESTKDVSILLADSINRIRRGELDPKVANTLT